MKSIIPFLKNKKMVLVFVLFFLFIIFGSSPVFAATCGGAETNIISCDDNEGGIWHILSLVLDIMSAGIGILGVIGIMVTGVQYLTAGDNEQQIKKAKNRIFQILIGLILYLITFVGLEWLLPGGIIDPQSDLASMGSTSQIEERRRQQEEARQQAEAQKAAEAESSSNSNSTSNSSNNSSNNSSLNSSSNSSTTKAKQISDLAWKIVNGKTDYTEIANANGYYDYMDKNCSKIGGGDCNRGKEGYDTFCSGFTYNVIRYTGVDPKYPMKLTGKQLDYANKSSKWQNVTNDVNGKTENLKPGDLLIKNGHTLLITQNSKGQLYAAQAAVGNHAPTKSKISSNTSLPGGAGSLSNYQVFRIAE